LVNSGFSRKRAIAAMKLRSQKSLSPKLKTNSRGYPDNGVADCERIIADNGQTVPAREGQQEDGGAGGIRTLDRALQPYNGLANRRLQPLGHSSCRLDMPDAMPSCKRQVSRLRFQGDAEGLSKPLYI
jgi:hypothetical protein